MCAMLGAQRRKGGCMATPSRFFLKQYAISVFQASDSVEQKPKVKLSRGKELYNLRLDQSKDSTIGQHN